MDPKVAKRIKESEDGQVLIKHLWEAVLSLDRVSDLKSEAPLDIAVEVKARQLAAEKLRSTLSTLLDSHETQNVRDTKDDLSVM